jgi:hypothetical protein
MACSLRSAARGLRAAVVHALRPHAAAANVRPVAAPCRRTLPACGRKLGTLASTAVGEGRSAIPRMPMPMPMVTMMDMAIHMV